MSEDYFEMDVAAYLLMQESDRGNLAFDKVEEAGMALSQYYERVRQQRRRPFSALLERLEQQRQSVREMFRTKPDGLDAAGDGSDDLELDKLMAPLPATPMLRRQIANVAQFALDSGEDVETVSAGYASYLKGYAVHEMGRESATDDEVYEHMAARHDLTDNVRVAAGYAGALQMNLKQAYASWERRAAKEMPGFNPRQKALYEAYFMTTARDTMRLTREYGPTVAERLFPGMDMEEVLGPQPQLKVLTDGSIGEKVGGRAVSRVLGQQEYGTVTLKDVPSMPEVVRLAGEKKVYLPNAKLEAAQADDKDVLEQTRMLLGMSKNFSSAHFGYSYRPTAKMLEQASENPKGDSAERYMVELSATRARNESEFPKRAEGLRASLNALKVEYTARHHLLLEQVAKGEVSGDEVSKLGLEYASKIEEALKAGQELLTQVQGALGQGTFSAQGYREVGESMGLGDLVQAYVKDAEREEYLSEAIRGGIPVVTGERTFLYGTIGADPRVDPLKRKEDQRLLALARSTVRAFTVTLKDGRTLRREFSAIPSGKLEQMRTEALSYIDRHSYHLEDHDADGTGVNDPWRTPDEPPPFVIPERDTISMLWQKEPPVTATELGDKAQMEGKEEGEKLPFLLRELGLANRIGDIESIQLDTPEKKQAPILQRMQQEVAPADAALNRYLDQFDLSPEERAVVRYRIISDGARAMPKGLEEIDLAEKLPYVGGGVAIANMWHIATIAERVARGQEVSQVELVELEQALLDMERKDSRAAVIVSGALDMMALGVEIGTTGGAVSLVRKIGKEAAEELAEAGLRNLGTHEGRALLRGALAKKMVVKGAEIAVQTAGPSAHRWAREAFVDAYVKGVNVYQGPDGRYHARLDLGHQRGSFWEKAPKAIANALVENVSEHTGGLLMKLPGAKEALGKLSVAAREELAKRAMLQLAIEKMGAKRAVEFFSSSNAKLGLHSTPGEVLEEFNAAIGHGLVDGKAPEFMSTDDVINMMASMVLARGVMGGGGGRGEQTNASNETPFPRQPQAPGFGINIHAETQPQGISALPDSSGGISAADGVHQQEGEDGTGGAAAPGLNDAFGGQDMSSSAPEAAQDRFSYSNASEGNADPFQPKAFGASFYLKKLKSWMKGEDIGREVISMGPTPPVLRVAGADAHSLVVPPGLFNKVTSKVHQVPMEALEQLPHAIANPVAIFQSRTEPDSIVVLTEFEEAGKGPMIVAVHLGKTADRNLVVNEVASIYGRPGADIASMFGEGLLYENPQKSLVWARRVGLQLPKRGTPSQGQTKIQHPEDVVKWVQSQPGAKPPSQSSSRPQGTGVYVAAQDAQQALATIRQQSPEMLDNDMVLVFANPTELAASSHASDYTAEELAQLQGREGVHDRKTGKSLIFTEQIELRAGETPLQAVGRVLDHERVGHEGVNYVLRTNEQTAARWKELSKLIPQDQLNGLLNNGYSHLANQSNALALEWLAQQAEQHRKGKSLAEMQRSLPSVAQQMWQALKEWVLGRRVRRGQTAHAGLDLDQEVANLLDQARAAVVSGKTREAAKGRATGGDTTAQGRFQQSATGSQDGSGASMPVPATPGAPNANEESDHAVPPGGAGGMAGGGVGGTGAGMPGGSATATQPGNETPGADGKVAADAKANTPPPGGPVWRVTDANGQIHEIAASEAATYREAAELFLKRFPKARLNIRSLIPPQSTKEGPEASVEAQEFAQAEIDGQLTVRQRFSQVGHLVRANHQDWRLIERLHNAAENYDQNSFLSFSTTAHLLALEHQQASNTRVEQPGKQAEDSPRPIQTAPIPEQTRMEPNTTGIPRAVLSPKHGPGGWGTRTWLTEPQAQTLLNTAERYEDQYFAFDDHTGRVYVYQESGDVFDIWHPYPSISDKPNDPSSKVPTEFLRGLRDSGRVSNSEYRRMTRGERIRD